MSEPSSLSSLRFRCFVLALVAAAYWPTLSGDFYFDDFGLFTDPAVIRPDGPLYLLSAESTRPVTKLTLWANYQLSGLDPFGYHLANVAIFLAACWLAASLFESIAAPRVAALATAVFSLHPLQTEAVGYSYARSGVLSTLFCLWCWRLWAQGRFGAAVTTFAAAALSKEDAVVLPIFLIGYELLDRNRRERKLLLAPLAAMMLVSLLVGGQALYATSVIAGAGAGFAAETPSPVEYLVSQGSAILLYLRLAIVPLGQNFDHDVSPVALAWAPLLLIIGACLWASRTRPEAYWALGALILLAPTSSIIPLADIAAERRMTLPLASLSLALAAVLAKLPVRHVAIVLAVGLAVLTYQRNQVWSSAEALWRDSVAKSPQKVRPKLQLARALPAERAELLRQARRLEPENVDVLLELGVERLQSGDPAGALETFQQARRVAPNRSEPAANEAAALILLERISEADVLLRQALAQDPCNYDARNNLIVLRRSQGQAAGAAQLAAEAPADCRWSEAQHYAMQAASEPRP